MPSNDRDVFDHLTSRADSGKQERQIAFLSYALFAFEKREWIKLFKARHDDMEPGQTEIDNWISNITESQFTAFQSEAERFFVDAADAYFEDRLHHERDEILRSAIVTEVKSAGSLGRQLSIALATAVLAPIIIGGIIAAAIVYDRNMITLSTVADHMSRTAAPGPPPLESPTK